MIPVYLAILLAIISTLATSLACFLYFIVIGYLFHKPANSKTGFDQVNIHALSSYLLLLVTNYYAYMAGILIDLLSIQLLKYASLGFYLSTLIAESNCIVTMLTKYAYLSYPHVMLEVSDLKIRIITLLAKGLCAFLFSIIDYYGPVQIKPLPYQLFAPNEQ